MANSYGQFFDPTNGQRVATFFAVCNAAGPLHVARKRLIGGDEMAGHDPAQLGQFYILPQDRVFDLYVYPFDD